MNYQKLAFSHRSLLNRSVWTNIEGLTCQDIKISVNLTLERKQVAKNPWESVTKFYQYKWPEKLKLIHFVRFLKTLPFAVFTKFMVFFNQNHSPVNKIWVKFFVTVNFLLNKNESLKFLIWNDRPKVKKIKFDFTYGLLLPSILLLLYLWFSDVYRLMKFRRYLYFQFFFSVLWWLVLMGMIMVFSFVLDYFRGARGPRSRFF